MDLCNFTYQLESSNLVILIHCLNQFDKIIHVIFIVSRFIARSSIFEFCFIGIGIRGTSSSTRSSVSTLFSVPIIAFILLFIESDLMVCVQMCSKEPASYDVVGNTHSQLCSHLIDLFRVSLYLC